MAINTGRSWLLVIYNQFVCVVVDDGVADMRRHTGEEHMMVNDVASDMGKVAMGKSESA